MILINFLFYILFFIMNSSILGLFLISLVLTVALAN